MTIPGSTDSYFIVNNCTYEYIAVSPPLFVTTFTFQTKFQSNRDLLGRKIFHYLSVAYKVICEGLPFALFWALFVDLGKSTKNYSGHLFNNKLPSSVRNKVAHVICWLEFAINIRLATST